MSKSLTHTSYKRVGRLQKPDVPYKRSGAEKEEQPPPLSKMDELGDGEL
jgi:hypothetical protein